MKVFVRGLALVILTATCFLMGMGAAHASWAGNHCNNNASVPWPGISRDGSRNYAVTANGDGYEWGGGCWNMNGVDDTPGAPDSGGEGADCSGFVFKSWGMASSGSSYRYWNNMTDIHGPYTANGFMNGQGASVVIGKAYGTAIYMDAFASTTHIGMIYSAGSNGTDTIIEAKGDLQGTGVWPRNYRSDGSYGGVRRANW